MEKKREFLQKKGPINAFLLFFLILIFSLGLTDTEINYAFQLIPQQGFYIKSPINKIKFLYLIS
jgi:hypothetical protein